MRSLYFLLLVGLLGTAQAQTGDFILSHHEPKNNRIDNTNYDILVDHRGEVCLANRSGVMKFDGLSWAYFSTPSAALSLAVDDRDSLYVGCLGMFGKITYKENREQFIPLYESENKEELFTQALAYRNGILFVSSQSICYYKNEKTTCVDGDFSNVYVTQDRLFVNTVDQSTYEVTPKKIIPIPSIGSPLAKVAANPSDSLLLGIDLGGGLFLIDSTGNEYLPQNRLATDWQLEIKDFEWVNDTLFACATAANGIALFSIASPGYIEITDYHSGLPDNEIFAIATDEESGVWAAHEYGLTRISPVFPAYSYSNFPGWDGNLIQVKEIRNKLWMNTSLGIYYLTRDTTFREEISFVDPPKNARKKRRFLDKVKDAVFNSDGQIRVVDKIPIGYSFRFKQVPGSSGKYKQLFPFNRDIIAVSNAGIHEVDQQGISLAISESVQFAYPLPDKNQIVLGNQIGQIKLYEKSKGYWVEVGSAALNELIVNIYRDADDHLWFAGSSGIHEGIITDQQVEIVKTYDLANQYFDKVSITSFDNRKFFVTSKGFYHLDSGAAALEPNVELNERVGEIIEHVENDEGEIWVYNGKIWYRISDEGTSEFKFLGIFPDLRYVSQDPRSKDYWLITADNELLKYTTDQVEDFSRHYPIYIKKITSTSGDQAPSGSLEFTYEDNQITFELVKPDYMGILHPEYQYKLDGLQNEWSSWSFSNRFDFNYLPPGAYALRVRTRDSFGSVEEATPIKFRVRAPYWQQPWFYLIQIVLLVTLVVYISRISDENRYSKILKGALSVMVLVFVIEFFQSVISAYISIESTPVIDFIIDASIALLIFPIEFLLRKLMLDSKVSEDLKERIKLSKLKDRKKSLKPIEEE